MLHVDFTPGKDPVGLAVGLARGINKAAENVAAKAMPLTPQDEGDLRGSQTVHEATAGDLKAAVSYDTPYAVRQHEELGYHHTEPGTQAKYLESPMNSSRDESMQIIAQAVREAL